MQRLQIRPRKPPLGFAAVPRHWFADSPVATHLANGVNLLFPWGERFFVRSVKRLVDQVDDPELREQVRGFFGQEGRHAGAHEQYFETMRAQGYQIDGFLAVYQRIAAWLERHSSPELNLAGTAAAEHFTAIMAEGALSRDLLDKADPSMRDLLKWHAAEEIEHKAVAFDVLARVNPSYRLRMLGLLLASTSLGAFWAAATLSLLRQDGISLREAARQLRAIRDARGEPLFAGIFLRGIREYARRDFHPAQNDNYHLARDYLAQAGLEPSTQSISMGTA